MITHKQQLARDYAHKLWRLEGIRKNLETNCLKEHMKDGEMGLFDTLLDQIKTDIKDFYSDKINIHV